MTWFSRTQASNRSLAGSTARLPHVHLELILLRFAQRVAKFVADRILSAGQAARGIRHALLQLLELVGHFVFFARQRSACC